MERIKELRRASRLSLKQLSERVGISERTLAFMEKTTYSNLDKIEAIANFFAVTPQYICGWDDEVPQDRRVVEKISEKVVYVPVYKGMTCIPSCWKPDDNGQNIRGMRRGKML